MDSKLSFIALTCTVLALFSSVDANTKKATSKREFKPSDVKFLSDQERKEWIAEMRASLPITKRQRGPFGMLQDPSAPVVERKAAPVKSDAFLNAIGALKVTALLPADDKFVIGAREFVEGEVIPMIRGQKQFNVEVISVRSDNILFKNVDTGEYVKRNMITLPEGLSKNAPLDEVDGITPLKKGKPAPLNID